MTIRQGKQIIANTQGTRNYDLLENKPKIDGVELSGEVTLDDLNVQSKLSAGTGIEIVDGVISNTQTKAEWGKITGNIAEQTDLQQELAKAGTPDDQTIIKTAENTLQAIGTIEKNKNLPKYDWIGTLAEYTSQNIETLHPDWVCYITDDLSGGTSVYTKSEVNELLDVKTNTDLDNLSSIGQSILDAKQDIATAVNYTNITNCITEIPQNIKLELTDGTLTLKAGSKVYVPNGFEDDGVTPKFDVVVIESDLSRDTFGTVSQTALLMYYNGSLTISNLKYAASGTTEPIVENWVFYNTTTNLLYDQTKTNKSFPLAVLSVSDGVLTSIDQVFNGFGYIGSTVFALPGVKGLIPNGRNADGSLKNIEFTVSNVFIDTISGNLENYNYYISPQNIGFYGRKFYSVKSKRDISTSVNSIFYVQDDNLMYTVKNTGEIQASVQYIPFCNYSASASVITSFTPKLPFHAVDRNDSSWVSAQAMPSGKYIDLTLGATGSGYTAPANGWVTLQTNAQNSSKFAFSSLGIPVCNLECTSHATSSNWSARVILPVKKGQSFYVVYGDTDPNHTKFRFIYAEGEN